MTILRRGELGLKVFLGTFGHGLSFERGYTSRFGEEKFLGERGEKLC